MIYFSLNAKTESRLQSLMSKSTPTWIQKINSTLGFTPKKRVTHYYLKDRLISFSLQVYTNPYCEICLPQLHQNSSKPLFSKDLFHSNCRNRIKALAPKHKNQLCKTPRIPINIFIYTQFNLSILNRKIT